jgi:hypothetical protein
MSVVLRTLGTLVVVLFLLLLLTTAAFALGLITLGPGDV